MQINSLHVAHLVSPSPNFYYFTVSELLFCFCHMATAESLVRNCFPGTQVILRPRVPDSPPVGRVSDPSLTAGSPRRRVSSASSPLHRNQPVDFTLSPESACISSSMPTNLACFFHASPCSLNVYLLWLSVWAKVFFYSFHPLATKKFWVGFFGFPT